MARTFHPVGRSRAALTLPLCLVAFTWATQAIAGSTPQALPGATRTITTPPTKTGNTTFTETTTEENFGTKAKPDWRRIETRRTAETPRTGENATDREIQIRRYDKGSKRATETITITEVEQPVFKLEPTIKSRTTTTTTYGNVRGKRKKVKKVVESWTVVEVGRGGVPIATGTRVTRTYGRGGKTVTENLNPRTGLWQVVKTPSSGKKKSASSKGPSDAQQKGLPTANPGQRGVAIPDVPHTGSYGGGSPKVPPSPKY